jgi:hypothetical protein
MEQGVTPEKIIQVCRPKSVLKDLDPRNVSKDCPPRQSKLICGNLKKIIEGGGVLAAVTEAPF